MASRIAGIVVVAITVTGCGALLLSADDPPTGPAPIDAGGDADAPLDVLVDGASDAASGSDATGDATPAALVQDPGSVSCAGAPCRPPEALCCVAATDVETCVKAECDGAIWTCDGPEDCPALTKACCAQGGGGRVASVTCQVACTAMARACKSNADCIDSKCVPRTCGARVLGICERDALPEGCK